jgi:hypothetical protein
MIREWADDFGYIERKGKRIERMILESQGNGTNDGNAFATANAKRDRPSGPIPFSYDDSEY